MILEDRLTEEGMDAVFADLDKSGFFERLKERLKQLDRSFAGLVWFKADYSEIDWHGGEVEFAYTDLSNGKTVLPVGCHRDYKGVKYRELPRGRVEVEDGKIVITVGKKCPKSAVDLIKKLYNLGNLENFIKEKHKSFWDPIGK